MMKSKDARQPRLFSPVQNGVATIFSQMAVNTSNGVAPTSCIVAHSCQRKRNFARRLSDIASRLGNFFSFAHILLYNFIISGIILLFKLFILLLFFVESKILPLLLCGSSLFLTGSSLFSAGFSPVIALLFIIIILSSPFSGVSFWLSFGCFLVVFWLNFG